MSTGRRRFLHALVATAGAVLVPACGGDGGDRSGTTAGSGTGPGGAPGTGDAATGTTATTGSPGSTVPVGADLPAGLDARAVPDTGTIHGWIRQIVEQGIRRPGYPADEWTERFVADRLREAGIDEVRLEPVEVARWELRAARLEVTPTGGPPRTLDCFPVPYAAPTTGLALELVAFDPAQPDAVAGRAALVDARVVHLRPPDALVAAGSVPADLSGRVHDPDGTFEGSEHVLPHTLERRRILDPAIGAGAAAFIGALVDYPGGGHEYYVPYDGEPRPVPGVWIAERDGAWLREQLAIGAVHVELTVDATTTPATSHNVVGELPGADDETVVVGSHHDGPWASAVEDASGTALVLAQARFWAAQPQERRPHRLVFVLHAGHMCGGAGLDAYLAAHDADLDRTVLEVHLEHAALDAVERDGQLVATERCTPRWFFTSRLAPLEAAVADAIVTEHLTRSMILAPDALGANPPTDGGAYHRHGVPIVQFLAAPSYLFDPADTLDKVDTDGLVPLTRATIRIVDATRGVSATAMRAG